MLMWSVSKFIIFTMFSGVYYAPQVISDPVYNMEKANGITNHSVVLISEYHGSAEISWGENYVTTITIGIPLMFKCAGKKDCLVGVVAHELGHTSLQWSGVPQKVTEIQADINSVMILSNAGYDPCALTKYFKAREDVPSNDHPLASERVYIIDKVCREFKTTQGATNDNK